MYTTPTDRIVPASPSTAERADAHATYRSDIDGLRAVAVMAVVLHHLSPEWLTGGFVGVDVFFVISGFLITRIISRELAEGRFSFARFYERRARRLFPALFAMLAATAAVGWLVLLPSDYDATLRALLGTLTFSSNIVFWKSGSTYFGAETKLNPLLHTWSLAVEEQFYLLFPIALLLCMRWFRAHTLRLVAVAALLSLAGAAVLVERNVTATFYLTPFRAWELLAGAMLALGAVPAFRSRALREIAVWGGVAAIVYACITYEAGTLFPGLAALPPVLGAAAVIHAGSSGPSTGARLLLQGRAMVFIGLISYSLYLWHWPVIVLAKHASAFSLPDWQLPVLLVLSMVLAWLSYRWIEQPGRRAGTGRLLALPAGVLSALALAGFCAWGIWMDPGWRDRFPPSIQALDAVRTEPISFVECAERPLEEACVLGAPRVQPDVLLWGDSHLLSWAPALHEVLADQQRSAVVASSTGCPPLLDTRVPVKPACLDHADEVRAYLEAHPHLRTVILSGYWSTYFREGSTLKLRAARSTPGHDLASVEGTGSPAAAGLDRTIAWLTGLGMKVWVIGPLPSFDHSIPATLAIESITGVSSEPHGVGMQQDLQRPFRAALEPHRLQGKVQFIDPMAWLCTTTCTVQVKGVSLYRDAHHLSHAGAMALKDDLARGLAMAAQAGP